MISQSDRVLERLIGLGRPKGYVLSSEIEAMLPDDMPAGPEVVNGALAAAGIGIIEGPLEFRSPVTVEADGGEYGEYRQEASPAPRIVNAAPDPMRMYLREMGTVPLLDRHGELEIARSLEQGEWLIYVAAGGAS